MPYLSGTLRPQGGPAEQLLAPRRAAPPNAIAEISGQRPKRRDQGQLPELTTSVPPGTVETLTLSDQMVGARLQLARLLRREWPTPTGNPDNCVHPEPGTAEVPVATGYSALLDPFVRFHSLLDLGVGEERCAADRARQGPEEDRTTPNYSYISPSLCDAGFPAGARKGRRRPRRRRRLPRGSWCRKSSNPPPTRRMAC